MTAPNPVLDANRPATAVAVAGRETASHLTTTSAGAATAYQPSDWRTWDEVTVETVPALAAELANEPCVWCGWLDNPAVFRVHGVHWSIAMDLCAACAGDAVASAAEHGRVLVETAS